MQPSSNHHILSGLTNNLKDANSEETQEWIESFDGLIAAQGTERAEYIMRALLQHAGTHSVESHGTALANVTETGNYGNLASNHDVGGTLDTVN